MLTALSRSFADGSRSFLAGLLATEALKSPAAGPVDITRKFVRERAALGVQLRDRLRVGCAMALAQLPEMPVLAGVGVARCVQVDGIAVPTFPVSVGDGDYLAAPGEGDGLTLHHRAPGRQPGKALAHVGPGRIAETMERLDSCRADVALQLFLLRIGQGGTMPAVEVLGEMPAFDTRPHVRLRMTGKRGTWIATMYADGAVLHDAEGAQVDRVSSDDIVSHAEVLALA